MNVNLQIGCDEEYLSASYSLPPKLINSGGKTVAGTHQNHMDLCHASDCGRKKVH